MKKYTLILSVLSFLLPAPAFAQFKNPARAAANLTRLERNIAQVTHAKTSPKDIAVRVPKKVIPGGYTVLSARPVPLKQTPANYSFVQNVQHILSQIKGSGFHKHEISRMIADLWARSTPGLAAGGSAFYDNQTTLAQDLHAFYAGHGPLYRAPGGHAVKMYSLPVDGILYQPAGYKHPVVLNAKDYFVLYDVDTQTGQLAENKPEVYQSFLPYEDNTLKQLLEQNRVQVAAARQSGENEELWEAIGGEKDYFESELLLAHDVDLFYYQQSRLHALRNSGVEGTVQELVDRTPKYKAPYPIYAPKVRDLLHHQEGYVLELPVTGLRYCAYGLCVTLSPERFVVLYFPGETSVVAERATVEDSTLFQPVLEK